MVITGTLVYIPLPRRGGQGGGQGQGVGTMSISLRTFWPSLLALAVALGVVIAADAWMPAHRAARLDLRASDLPETFIMHSKNSDDRGFVVGRRSSTMRRSDRKLAGVTWRLARIPPRVPGGREGWMTQSKRQGKGTALYLPFDQIEDWSWPLIHGFVRQQRPDLALPEVRWTQLYVDRAYRGLYLQITLPFDPRSADGRVGPLRDLLALDAGRMCRMTTRLSDERGVWDTGVATGVFPTVQPADPLVRWLSATSPASDTTLVLSAGPGGKPLNAAAMPMPVSLPAVFAQLHGRRPATHLDVRMHELVGPLRQVPEGAWSQASLQALRPWFDLHGRQLLVALRIQAEIDGDLDGVRAAVAQRQAAARLLGLELSRIGPQPAVDVAHAGSPPAARAAEGGAP